MAKNPTPAGASPAPRQATHTKGEWKLSEATNGLSIYAGGEHIALVEPDDEVTRANAERIVSCVNALEGVSNPIAVKQLIVAARNCLPDWEIDANDPGGQVCCEMTNKDVRMICAALAALDTTVPKTEERHPRLDDFEVDNDLSNL